MPVPTPTTPPAPTATSARRAALGPVRLESAFGGRRFDRPVEIGAFPTGRMFVAEQGGTVFLLDMDGTGLSALLDIAVRRSGNEEGLLSVALDPSFDRTGHLWVYYSVPDGQRRTRLSRFTVVEDRADPASELVILEIAQPFSNHNGGAVRFGPDGMLYLGLGDGGSGGDPRGNGQDPWTLLGTVIRLDVRETSASVPYRVPSDNPFVEGGGRPEVWAYGLRNPWRMAFDSASGELWLADVGQNAVEEVDIIRRGGNYGWNVLEGDRCFRPRSGCDDLGKEPPIAVYGRDQGCSVTGGLVYRGTAVAEITGAYLFSDFCSGQIWAIDAGDRRSVVKVAEADGQVSSFGIDSAGEVYILQFRGPVLRIVPP